MKKAFCILFQMAFFLSLVNASEKPAVKDVVGGQETLSKAIAEFRLQHYSQSFPIFQSLAQGNNPIAQFYYASSLQYGYGTKINKSMANGLYKKVFPIILDKARGEDVLSQAIVANMYLVGSGTPKNLPEAINWYRKAAYRDYAPAQVGLGRLYYKGDGVTQSMYEAMKWYEKAATQGYAPALFYIGMAYADGMGKEQSSNPNCQPPVCQYYADGIDQEQSSNQADLKLKEAASQNYPPAQYVLALRALDEIQHNHSGSERYDEDRRQAAMLWLQKADEEGDVDSQLLLAELYERGHIVRKDTKLAMDYYRKGAVHGDLRAQFKVCGPNYFLRKINKDEEEYCSLETLSDADLEQLNVVLPLRNKLVKKYGDNVTLRSLASFKDELGNPSVGLALTINLDFQTLDITGSLTLQNVHKTTPQNLLAYLPFMAYRENNNLLIGFGNKLNASDLTDKWIVSPGEIKTFPLSFQLRMLSDDYSGEMKDAVTEIHLLKLKEKLMENFAENSANVALSVNPNQCLDCEIYLDFKTSPAKPTKTNLKRHDAY